MTRSRRRSIKSNVVSLCLRRNGDQMVMRGLALLLIMLSLATSAAFGDVLIGRHKVRGTTPDGYSYRGTVDISIQGGVYFVRWHLTNGEIYHGQGRLEGDTLTIEWGDATPVIYKVEPNGVLRGTWGGGKGTDTLTPEKETIAFNKLGEGCDPDTKTADELIKGCTELIDMWKGPSGKSTDALVPTFFLWRSEGWAMKHEPDRALADIERAIGLAPDISWAYYLRAKIYIDKLEYDRALPDLDKAIGLDPKNATIFYARGFVFEQKGDNDRARADYQKSLEISAGHDGAKEGLARLNQAATTGAEACGAGLQVESRKKIAACTELIGKNSKDAAAYRNRGLTYALGCTEHVRACELAATDFETAIKLEPKLGPEHAEMFRMRGWNYQHRQDNERALADYTQAIALDPKSTSAYINRVDLLVALGQHQAALADYGKLIELVPEQQAHNYAGRGRVYIKMGDYQHALPDYEKAFAAYPEFGNYKRVYEGLKAVIANPGSAAECSAELRPDVAFKACTDEIEADAKNAAAYFHRANLNAREKKTEEALTDYNKAIELDPKQAEFFRWRADLFATIGRSDDQLADYDRMISLDSKNAEYFVLRGRRYHGTGAFKKAIADWSKAISLDPKRVMLLCNRADSYSEMGDAKRAAADVKAAEKLGGEKDYCDPEIWE